jgi:hypothetical protein
MSHNMDERASSQSWRASSTMRIPGCRCHPVIHFTFIMHVLDMSDADCLELAATPCSFRSAVEIGPRRQGQGRRRAEVLEMLGTRGGDGEVGCMEIGGGGGRRRRRRGRKRKRRKKSHSMKRRKEKERKGKEKWAKKKKRKGRGKRKKDEK